MANMAGLRGFIGVIVEVSSSLLIEVVVESDNGMVVDDVVVVVENIRRRVVPNIADDPFENVKEEDGIRCC
jgi:hypothetical protein